MASTVVGVFDNYGEAQQVSQELIGLGFSRDRIRVMNQSQSTGATQHEDKGFWESLKDMLGFGDDDESYGYREAARRGGTLVAVTTDDAHVDQVVAVMQRHNVIDLDQRAEQWRREGSAGSQAAATGTAAAGATSSAARGQATRAEGQEAIPVVEEQLHIGKQQVRSGGVRIHTRVTERPVEEQVTLREETVRVERRPVDRPLQDADRAFQERTIEATETNEVAVVNKTARVVEEVVVNKDVEQRTEKVRDTVRRTDVEVEKTDPNRAPQGGADRSRV